MKDLFNKDIKPIEKILLGFQIEAAMVLLLQIVTGFYNFCTIHFVAIAVTLFAWALVVIGFQGIYTKHENLKKCRIASMVAFVCIVLQLVLSIKDVIQGAGVNAFVDTWVALFSYIATIAMIYIFLRMMTLFGKSKGVDEVVLRKEWKWIILFILGSLFLSPLMLILPIVINWILSIAFALAGVGGKLYGCSKVTEYANAEVTIGVEWFRRFMAKVQKNKKGNGGNEADQGEKHTKQKRSKSQKKADKEARKAEKQAAKEAAEKQARREADIQALRAAAEEQAAKDAEEDFYGDEESSEREYRRARRSDKAKKAKKSRKPTRSEKFKEQNK